METWVVEDSDFEGEMKSYRNFETVIAKNLHKSVNQISTTRAQLINKGIIFYIRYKKLDFTVLEFDGYIKQLDEYKQWLEEQETI